MRDHELVAHDRVLGLAEGAEKLTCPLPVEPFVQSFRVRHFRTAHGATSEGTWSW